MFVVYLCFVCVFCVFCCLLCDLFSLFLLFLSLEPSSFVFCACSLYFFGVLVGIEASEADRTVRKGVPLISMAIDTATPCHEGVRRGRARAHHRALRRACRCLTSARTRRSSRRRAPRRRCAPPSWTTSSATWCSS